MTGPTVYFDLETGGLDRLKNPIIQIAAIAVGPDGAELETFHQRVLFEPLDCDPKALEINHYEPEIWKREGITADACEKLLTGFLRRHTAIEHKSKASGKPYRVARLAGHNAAAFDGPFLQHWYKSRSNTLLPADPRVLCTTQLAMWVSLATGERPKSFRLVDCCLFWGVPLEGAHDALVDVRATAGLARVLTGIIARGGAA